MPENRTFVLLMADDDADDRLLASEALDEVGLQGDLRFVADGEELLRYLRRDGEYAEPGAAPRPNLVLLDLNMPRLDGRSALEEIKGDPELRVIPVVVITTSSAQEDILNSYLLGAASFITKPVTFEELVEMMRSLSHYWTRTVTLPDDAL